MYKKTLLLSVALLLAISGPSNCLYAGEAREADPRVPEGVKKAEEAAKAAEEAKKVVVARVNGTEINMFILVRAMNRIAPKYAGSGEPLEKEKTEAVKREALERLIFEELAVQEAIRQGISPVPEEVERVVAQVKANLVTEEAYKRYLDDLHLTEDALKKLIERSRRYEMITAREVYGKTKVDEKLLRDEYDKEKAKFIKPENFVVEDVYFFEGKDEEAIRRKADQTLEAIKRNGNDVWKLVLDGSFIIRKMSVREGKNPELHKTIAGMEVGELSGIIRDNDGFHIIKVVKKEPSRQLTFEEAKSSIEPKFLVPAQEKRKKEWERELRQGAKIEIMLDKN